MVSSGNAAAVAASRAPQPSTASRVANFLVGRSRARAPAAVRSPAQTSGAGHNAGQYSDDDSTDEYSDSSSDDDDQPVRSATEPTTTTGSSSPSVWRRFAAVCSANLLKSAAPPDQYIYQAVFAALRQAREAHQLASKAAEDAKHEQKYAQSTQLALVRNNDVILDLDHRLCKARREKCTAEERLDEMARGELQYQQFPIGVLEQTLQTANSEIASLDIALEAAKTNKRSAEAQADEAEDATAKAADKANRLIEHAHTKWQDAQQVMTEINTQAGTNLAHLNQAVEKAKAEAQDAHQAAGDAASSSSTGKPPHRLQVAVDSAERKTREAEKHATEVVRTYRSQKGLLQDLLRNLQSEVTDLQTAMQSYP